MVKALMQSPIDSGHCECQILWTPQPCRSLVCSFCPGTLDLTHATIQIRGLRKNSFCGSFVERMRRKQYKKAKMFLTPVGIFWGVLWGLYFTRNPTTIQPPKVPAIFFLIGRIFSVNSKGWGHAWGRQPRKAAHFLPLLCFSQAQQVRAPGRLRRLVCAGGRARLKRPPVPGNNLLSGASKSANVGLLSLLGLQDYSLQLKFILNVTWLGSNTNILFLNVATSEVEYTCDHFS